MPNFRTALFAAALAFCAQTQAAVITFNNLAGTNVPGSVYVYSNQYTQMRNQSATVDGFTFASTVDEIFMRSGYANGGDTGYDAYNGTDFLMTYSTVTMRNVTATPFSVNSLDLVNWSGYGLTATLKGTRMDGTTITQLINLDTRPNNSKTVGNDFTNYALSGFTGLKSFSIGSDSGNWVALDNIAVNAVPEPASLAILGLGLGALAIARRRKA